MLVGAAKIDITPSYSVDLSGYLFRAQPAVGVRDPIHVRAAAFESNGTRLAIISAEIIDLPRPMVEEVRQRVAQVLDTLPEHVCLSCTHTHYAPATWPLNACGGVSRRFQLDLMDHIPRVAKDAADRLAPVRLVRGTAPLRIGRNRRNADGRPCDDTLRVLAAMGEDDRPRLLLMTYACHPVCLSPADRQISGDYCGVACTQLEARHDDCIAMFVNGCAGDIDPMDEYRASPEDMRRAGRRMADAAAQVEFSDADGDALRGRYTLVNLPYEGLDPDRRREELAGIDALDQPDSGERAKRAWLLSMLNEPYPESMPVAVQHLCIGAVDLVTISGEVLWGIKEQIDSAHQHLWIAAYCNGGHGYIPTTQAQDEGGYEPDSANWYYMRPPLARCAGEQLAEAAIAFMTCDPTA